MKRFVLVAEHPLRPVGRGGVWRANSGVKICPLKRAYFRTIPPQDVIIVEFTGEQLNQTDLDVWETIVHSMREQPLAHFAVSLPTAF